LAKAKDLHGVTKNIEPLQTTATDLKDRLRDFGNHLQELHERIEGAARLHHLLDQQPKDDDVHQEMQKLAERIGVHALTERCRYVITTSISSCNKNGIVVESLEFSKERMSATSTPEKSSLKMPATTPTDCQCWQPGDQEGQKSVSTLPPLIEDTDAEMTKRKQVDEDEEDHSKMADSGLGGCDRCEGNEKLTRACSCQSFEDATLACGKR
jgi:pleckstrin homology domain-containing family G member 4